MWVLVQRIRTCTDVIGVVWQLDISSTAELLSDPIAIIGISKRQSILETRYTYPISIASRAIRNWNRSGDQRHYSEIRLGGSGLSYFICFSQNAFRFIGRWPIILRIMGFEGQALSTAPIRKRKSMLIGQRWRREVKTRLPIFSRRLPVD